jgi:hypothetical protein
MVLFHDGKYDETIHRDRTNRISRIHVYQLFFGFASPQDRYGEYIKTDRIR